MPGPMPVPSPMPVPAPAPAGGRDAYGCITSAGYTWCPLTKTCNRVWETPCVAEPNPVDPVHPEPIGKHFDTHGCNLSAGYRWCPTSQQCQKYSDKPCMPLGPGGQQMYADTLEPPEPIIPLNPEGPTSNVCDFSSPFFCTANQEVAFEDLPAVSMGGQPRACVLPVSGPGDVGCDVLSAGECGMRGGAFIPDAKACPRNVSTMYNAPYLGTVTAGGVAQSAAAGHSTPMLGFL